MPEVHLWSGLRQYTGGDLIVTVEASTVREMLDALVKTHPALAPVIEAGVSVAVDGEVIASGFHSPIRPDSEIYLMQRIKGG
jgi:molybdopterin synthase sulfur carrier subunit